MTMAVNERAGMEETNAISGFDMYVGYHCGGADDGGKQSRKRRVHPQVHGYPSERILQQVRGVRGGVGVGGRL
jgi:hypothetical protein